MLPRIVAFSICLIVAGKVSAEPLAAPPQAPTAPNDAVTIYHWWTSASETAALNALVGVFKNQHPGATVSPRATGTQGGGSRMFQLVSQATSGGSPSHVFQVLAGAPLRTYFDAGLLIRIDEAWTTSGLEKVVPAMVRKMSQIDGHYYALPINVHRNNLVWYNKALLDKHGIDPATLTSWDAFFKAADKLKAAGVASPLQFGGAWTLSMAFEGVLAGLGIGPYEDWINGKITAPDDPRLAEALGILKRYLSYANRDYDSATWDTAIQRIIRGEAAFCIMGDWADGEFLSARQKYGKDYGAVPVPGTKGMYGVTADAFAQTRGAAGASSASLWMAVAASREGQDAFNAAKGSIPARTDADVSKYASYQRSAIAEFKSARYIYPNFSGATHDAFKNSVDGIMRRFAADQDVKKAAAAMATSAAQSSNKFRQAWSLQ